MKSSQAVSYVSMEFQYSISETVSDINHNDGGRGSLKHWNSIFMWLIT
jgi:hypothetical protein